MQRAQGEAVVLDGFAERYELAVETLTTREENMFFPLPRNLREAGRQLHASAVLEGSVQRSDGRIRINAQLVRVADDVTIWAGRFDRDVNDVQAIQDDISRSIVNELRLKFDPSTGALSM